MTVHAVCIYAPAGYEVAEQYHFTVDRNAPLVTTCPTGKVAFGGGGTVYRGTWNLHRSYPGPAGSAIPNQWIVSGYDVHAEQLRVDGYAICADPIAGLTKTRYTHTISDDVAGGVLQCATDKKVVGGGAAARRRPVRHLLLTADRARPGVGSAGLPNPRRFATTGALETLR
ncbi:hypothetical protein ACF1E9_31245, partial [Streptomyces roseolus]|uniref:hypothetical protein n=1 Tax=Streptomyces roseolus TaxID=67358 RepID=UPI003700223C